MSPASSFSTAWGVLGNLSGKLVPGVMTLSDHPRSGQGFFVLLCPRLRPTGATSGCSRLSKRPRLATNAMEGSAGKARPRRLITSVDLWGSPHEIASADPPM